MDNLRSLDQLLVKQTVKASSLFSNYRGNKEFIIKNGRGQTVNCFNFSVDFVIHLIQFVHFTGF